MTNGIVQTEQGFSVKDFETGVIVSDINRCRFTSYTRVVEAYCGDYEESFRSYLLQAASLGKEPDADTWENMIYADDPRGVYDGEKDEYRNVTEMDRGAATEEEIAYVDALDATYKSLMAMVD